MLARADAPIRSRPRLAADPRCPARVAAGDGTDAGRTYVPDVAATRWAMSASEPVTARRRVTLADQVKEVAQVAPGVAQAGQVAVVVLVGRGPSLSIGRRSVDRVAQDRAGHAAAPATSAAQLARGNGDDLDARLAEQGVGEGVPVVADDDTGLERHDVVAVVPLLPHRAEPVTAGGHDPEVDAERRCQGR